MIAHFWSRFQRVTENRADLCSVLLGPAGPGVRVDEARSVLMMGRCLGNKYSLEVRTVLRRDLAHHLSSCEDKSADFPHRYASGTDTGSPVAPVLSAQASLVHQEFSSFLLLQPHLFSSAIPKPAAGFPRRPLQHLQGAFPVNTRSRWLNTDRNSSKEKNVSHENLINLIRF